MRHTGAVIMLSAVIVYHRPHARFHMAPGPQKSRQRAVSYVNEEGTFFGSGAVAVEFGRRRE